MEYFDIYEQARTYHDPTGRGSFRASEDVAGLVRKRDLMFMARDFVAKSLMTVCGLKESNAYQVGPMAERDGEHGIGLTYLNGLTFGIYRIIIINIFGIFSYDGINKDLATVHCVSVYKCWIRLHHTSLHVFQVMMKAHTEGVAVVGTYDFETAETYCAGLKAKGLSADIIPVEGE